MYDPPVKTPAAIDESEETRFGTFPRSSTSTHVFWAAVAALLLIQILGWTYYLRTRGIVVHTLSGLPGAILFVGIMVLAALILRFVVHRWRPKAGGPNFVKSSRQLVFYCAELVTVTIVLALMGFACSWPKVMIPVVNSRLWDEALIGIDTALFLGINPNEFFLTVFEGAPHAVNWLLDHHYAWFIFSQGLATAWFLADPRPRRRIAFGSSVILLWILGTYCYLILPTLGPVYVFEGFLPRVNATFPMNAGTQVALLNNYESVKLLMAGEPAHVIPFYGIAAMPSLHVAAHFFLFLWARFVASPLRYPLLAMATLTLIGSVAIGWHYLVDGLAGMVLAAAAFALAVGMYRVLVRVTFMSGDDPSPQ